MECQEFAYETVVDRGIIRSPAKRENGINRRKSSIPFIVLPFFFVFKYFHFIFFVRLHYEGRSLGYMRGGFQMRGLGFPVKKNG